MDVSSAAGPTDLPERRTSVRAWDLPTRLFHWLLVAAVAVSAVTGFLAPERWLSWHSASGYAIVLLIAFRLVWGFFGSELSRFADFRRTLRRLADHLRGLLRLRPPHSLGHNPLGVLMIIALAATLLALAATGLLVLGGTEKQGPLAGLVDFAVGDGVRWLHETLAWLLLALIAGHLLGIIGESLLTRENLAWAMVTGRKWLPAGSPIASLLPARSLPAALLTAAIGATLATSFVTLGQLPPLGLRALAANAEYEEECGACHYAYHPSLLPAASWRVIMTGLDDHFGDDASLDAATAAGLGDWLAANAAETWDTKAANRLRPADAVEPRRVTATAYWRNRHAELGESVFARRGIKSKINCVACHGDAASGRFDDQAIAIPEE